MADEETSDWETNLKTEYADFFLQFLFWFGGKACEILLNGFKHGQMC